MLPLRIAPVVEVECIRARAAIQVHRDAAVQRKVVITAAGREFREQAGGKAERVQSAGYAARISQANLQVGCYKAEIDAVGVCFRFDDLVDAPIIREMIGIRAAAAG